MSAEDVDSILDGLLGDPPETSSEEDPSSDEGEPVVPNGVKPPRKRKRPLSTKPLDGGSVKKLKRRAGIERAGEKLNSAVRDLVRQRLSATVGRAFVHMTLARKKKTLRREDVLAALRSMDEIMAS